MFHARDLAAGDAVPAAPPALKQRRIAPGLVARQVRLLHLCLAALFAPAILFFAVTGALQTFTLHKANATYAAPDWIVRAAAVHKRQTLAPKADDDQAATPKHAKHKHDKPAAAVAAPPMPWQTLILKVFAVAVAAAAPGGLTGYFPSGSRPAFRIAPIPTGDCIALRKASPLLAELVPEVRATV